MGALIAEWIKRNRRLIGAGVGVAVALVVIARLRGAVTPFAMAIVLAYLFNPMVKALVRRGLKRPVALLLIYLVFLVAVGVGIGLLVPRIVLDLTRLAEFLPGYFAQLQQMAYDLQEQYSQVQLPQAVRQAIDDAFLAVQGRLLGVVTAAVTGILGVFSTLFSLMAAVVLSYYLIRDAASIRAGIGRLVRAPERQYTMAVLSRIDKVVAGFVRGQLTVALIVGVLIATALWLLGVRFAAILGIVAGISNVIPYFGPVIGAIPALAVTVTVSPALALKVLAVFVVVQQIDGQLLSPRILGKSVGLHPVVVIFALLAGYQLFGVLGMIAAVPAAGIIRILLDLWLADRDSDQATAPETAAGTAPGAEAAPGETASEAGQPAKPQVE
jgi:predicted PurR-regulated permease PerM